MLPYTSGSWLDLVVRVGGRDAWRGFQTVAAGLNKVSGYVKTSGGSPVEDAWIGVFNSTVYAGSETDDNGFYAIYVPDGTYRFGAWASDGSELYWQDNLEVLGDTTKNVTQLAVGLTLGTVTVSPSTAGPGDTITVSFSVTDSEGDNVHSLPDEAFTMWISHVAATDWGTWDWFTENPSHDDITDDVIVIETLNGYYYGGGGGDTWVYTFDFTLPSASPYTIGEELCIMVSVGGVDRWASILAP